MSEDVQQESASESSVKKSRVGMRLLRWGVVLVLLVVVLVGLLPAIASSGWGNQLITRALNQQLNGQFSASQITIGWVRGPAATDLQLKTAEGETIASVGSVVAPRFTLLRLLGGSMDLGEVRLSDVQAEIVQHSDGSTNLTDVLAPLLKPSSKPKKKQAARIPAGSAIDFQLKGTNFISYEAPGMEPVRVELNKLTITAPNPQDLQVSFQAAIRQGVDNGSVALEASFADAVDSDGQLDFAAAKLDADLALSSIPVVALDRLLNLNEALVLTLGPQLHSHVKAQGGLYDLTAEIMGDTEHMKAALQLEVEQTGDGPVTRLSEAGGVQLTLTPEAIAAWQGRLQPNVSAAVVQEAVDVTLTFDELRVGQRNGKPNLAGMSLKASAEVGEIRLGLQSLGELSLSGLQAELSAARLGESLALTTQAIARQGTHEGDFVFQLHVDGLGDETGGVDFQSPDLAVGLKGQVAAFPLAFIDQVASMQGVLVEALGEQLEGQVRVDVKPNAEGQEAGEVSLQLSSGYMDAEWVGQVDVTNHIYSTEGETHWTLRPELVALLLPADENSDRPVALIEPIKVQVVHSLGKGGVAGDYEDAHGKLDPSAATTLSLQVQASEVGLQLSQLAEPLSITELKLHLPATPFSYPLETQLQGVLAYQQYQTPFYTDLKASEWLTASPSLETRIKIPFLPVRLMDELAQVEGLLLSLLGDSIPVTVQADTSLGQEMELDVSLETESEMLEAKVDAVLSPKQIEVTRGSRVKLNLSAEAGNELLRKYVDDQPKLEVIEPLPVALVVQRAVLPLVDGGVSLPGSQMQVQALMPQVGVLEPETQSFVDFEAMKLNLTSEALAKQVSLSIQGGVEVLPIAERQSAAGSYAPIDLHVDAKGLLDKQGKFSTESLEAEVKGDISEFPVMVVDQLAGMDELLVNTLGDFADLNVAGRFPGMVQVQGRSDFSTVQLPLSVDRERATLAEDGVVTLEITPRTVEGVLGQMHPALGDAVGSEKPVVLTIHHDGFYLPIAGGYDVAKAKITGTLDAGVISMAKAGWLFQGLNGAVKGSLGVSSSERAQSRRQMESDENAEEEQESYQVMFTPVDFKLENGVLKTTELWMTSPTIGIGFQGQANLVSQKIDMAMGILGASLISEEFGAVSLVEQGVRPEQIYDLPMFGTLNEPEPDYEWLTIQLTGSAARNVLDQSTNGLGGVLIDVIGGHVQEQKRNELNISWDPPLEWIEPAIATATERMKVFRDRHGREAEAESSQQTPGQSEETEQTPKRLTPEEAGKKILEELFR